MSVTYDFASLERLIIDPNPDWNDGPVASLAARLGVASNTIFKYRKNGMRTDTADRLAIKAGLHPSLVWETWWSDASLEVCPACDEPLSFMNRSTTLCPHCSKRLGDWERTRNRGLQRAFWARLDRYRETVDPFCVGKRGAACVNGSMTKTNAAVA